jgi:DegV family protein with EDD domain
MTIRIVTDSTSDLPPDLAARHEITVLPTYVNVGQESYLDGVDLTRAEFYARLPQFDSPPTTAAPAVGAFSQTYEKLAREGVSAILSIHLASDLSGVLNVARLGAEAAESVDVTLFDSHQVSMGLGFLALSAARAAQSGATISEIVTTLEATVPRTYVFAMLDTLEYLRRSGRVSWPEFSLGTLLRIKPLLQVYKGHVQSLEKVRTQSRALEHLMQHVADLGPLRELALLHTANPQGAKRLRDRATELIPEPYSPVAVEVTPTIGAHVGPGALGFACIVD